MGIKILIGVFIFVACFGASFMLVFDALREIKEQKKDLIKLKLNVMDIINSFLLDGLTFGLSQTLLYWLILFPPANFPTLLFIIIIPFVFLASIDFVILISHIINEKRHTINWDTKQNIISVNQDGNEFQLDLNSETLQIIHYYPPIRGGFRGFPGFSFHVLVLSENENKVRISSIIYDYYDFALPLTKHKNYIVIKRQFNILI